MTIDPVSLAITAAMTAAQTALTAMQTVEGPRLTDTRATVADFGTPLNYFIGRRLLSCPCFFAKPIRDKKKKRKGKAGKQISHTAFCTWAAHVADRPITAVLKIWFDNHLVYDATGTEPKLYPLAKNYELAMHMRIYYGTEDQEPDPDMLAFVEARDGPGTCSAYRGTSYIYFENIPTEQLGNRFPDVRVLAATTTSTAPALPVDEYHNLYHTFPRLRLGDPGYPPAGTLYPASLTLGPYGSRVEVRVSTALRADDRWVLNGTDGLATYGVGIVIAIMDAGSTLTLQLRNTGNYWCEGKGIVHVVDVDEEPGEPDEESTLGALLTRVARSAGLADEDFDFSAATQTIEGYNWSQGTGAQIVEPLLDLFDVDIRPHDFVIEALARGGAAQGTIALDEVVPGEVPWRLTGAGDTDLPRQIFLAYSDTTADQQPNVAASPGRGAGASGSENIVSVDMSTLAASPDAMQRLAERKLRRAWIGHVSAELSLTRRRLAVEPGDVWTFDPGDVALTACCRRLAFGADGRVETQWERDDPSVAVLSASTGAPAVGAGEETIPDDLDSLGDVMDLPLLIDAHDQTAPLAYLAAGPAGPGIWTGADFAASDTGEPDSYLEGWDGVPATEGAVIGTCLSALPPALPWVPDTGSALSVEINAGELTSATLDELLLDATRNLAAIRSGTGWELVQFMTATLTAERTYDLAGFLRGLRGSEWAISGHGDGDRFILLDDTARRHTLGASEIADSDWYIVSSAGQSPDETNAVDVTFTAASHKPYAPVDGNLEQDGADWLISATRRTRIGAANLDGGDVPLGETAEAWEADVMDGGDVVRTIAGASLPLTWTEAQQIADFGGAQSTLTVRLYQMSPSLGLRGYPLEISA